MSQGSVARVATCWLCHGWGFMVRRREPETAWSDATGGPVYTLHVPFGAYQGELIRCPECKGSGKS